MIRGSLCCTTQLNILQDTHSTRAQSDNTHAFCGGCLFYVHIYIFMHCGKDEEIRSVLDINNKNVSDFICSVQSCYI